MGTTAARKAAEILKNSRRIVATEIMAACQALDLKLENHELGKGTNQPMTPSVSMSALSSLIRVSKSTKLNKASELIESDEF